MAPSKTINLFILFLLYRKSIKHSFVSRIDERDGAVRASGDTIAAAVTKRPFYKSRLVNVDFNNRPRGTGFNGGAFFAQLCGARGKVDGGDYHFATPFSFRLVPVVLVPAYHTRWVLFMSLSFR